MEEKQTVSGTPQPEPQQQAPNNGMVWMALLSLVVLSIAGGCAVYSWQDTKVVASSLEAKALTNQVDTLTSQIKYTTDSNGGTASSAAQSTSSGKVELASGDVIATLPSNWVKATASNLNTACSGGSLGSTVLCEDITTLVPSSLNRNDPNNLFGVNVAVYEHTDNKNAKDWFGTDYGADFAHTNEPQTIDTSAQPINGYDAYTYTTKYSDTDYPTTVHYGIVHRNYVVVVTSTYKAVLNPSGTPNGSVQVDYSKYLPDVQAIANSIKINS